MHRKIIYLLVVGAVAIASCNNESANPENVAGGACTFDTIVRSIAVTSITKDSSGARMVLRNASHDSLYHSIPAEAYSKYFQNDSIAVGDEFELLAIKPVNGSCTEQPSLIRKGAYIKQLDGKY